LILHKNLISGYFFFEALWGNGRFQTCFVSRFLPIPFHHRRSLTCGKEASHSSAEGRLKSTQMTLMMWICTDKNEAYKTKDVDYP
jgi:hypothetical protein